MSFSASVRITNLDDFIGPAAECIKPIPPAAPAQDAIQIRNSNDFSQVIESGSARITLNDCLACNGCVTSAETLLINQQSVQRLYEEIGSKTIIFSVSPQSRASLSARFNLDLLTASRKITGFLKTFLGASHVFDASLAADISLIEQRLEFLNRYKSAKAAKIPGKNLPLLTSECPGWVCYAEKTQGDVLPYISSVRSPQQILGAAIKRHLGFRDIFHVCIMPCFDKKLEASRVEFQGDVDLVLSTSEIAELIEGKIQDLSLADSADLSDNALLGVDDYNRIIGVEDRLGSGAYLDHVFRFAAERLFGEKIQGPLEFRQISRNSDFQETCLEVNGVKVLRFAYAYGFRNIQNLIRKIKSGKCPYHFVEVMACPSGCLNGGGQIQSEPKSRKELLEKVAKVYDEFERHDPDRGPTKERFYSEWMKGEKPGSESIRAAIHTSYRALETSSSGFLEKW